MGLLSGMKKTLGSIGRSSNTDVIVMCLGDISSALVKHLSAEHYRWSERTEIKTFESLILARFLLEHALAKSYGGKLSDPQMQRYRELIQDRFAGVLEGTFQSRFTYAQVRETINNRVAIFERVMAEQSHPACWQILASVVTSVDYAAEKDITTLAAASLAISELLKLAQTAVQITVDGSGRAQS